jgi:murein DD-endopeptidase MepM/ murein hydrolase activator NlpD
MRSIVRSMIFTALLLSAAAIVLLSQAPSLAQLPAVAPNFPVSSGISVSPNRPELGDTIAVTVPRSGLSTAPSVSWNGKTYAMFAIAGDRYRALLPTTPLDRPGNITLQVNGANPQTVSVPLASRDFPTQSITLPPGQDGSVSDTEFDRINAFKAIVSPDKLWNGPLRRPNDGPVTTVYGVRRYYNGVFADDYFHRGVDYAGDVGSAVVAPANARVVFVGYERDGFVVHGNCIGLDHGQGVTSIYIHLNRINVRVGDVVQAGQTIGTLGSTGAATGPHLHWGWFVQGEAVDPVPWREQGFE